MIHERLLKLYKLKQKLGKKPLPKGKRYPKYTKDDWWQKSREFRYSSCNRVIKKEKARLEELLDERLHDSTPRELDPGELKDKNIISLFESSLTRALGISTNSLTQDLFVVNVYFFQVFENIVKDGFTLNGERYIFLTASAGQIRTKKAVFIKESKYEEIQPKIMCGLTIRDINDAGGINPNKFLAYLALANSATDVWQDFDIDKSIVVDDFETDVLGEVDYIDDVTYDIERKKIPVSIAHMDGAGIMLDGPTRMVRLPWVKGLLIQFPFDKFIQEKCHGGKVIIKDIYGQEHDVLGEDIRYIFTKSQFKLWKYYPDWSTYKQYFKKYQCEACYCNIEEEKLTPSRINYQMLQTLSDITDDEIQRLVARSVSEIEEIGHDYPTTMRLLGATEDNKNPSWFQQALMIYPELFKDQYCRDVLKQTKISLVKQAKAGRLRVNGGYVFVSPDLYAFCEWLFLGIENPNGLLNDGEVYCRDFLDSDELACLRSPHLYREWPIRYNKRNDETDRWFGGTRCVYISCHDLISKIVQADFDGDRLLVIKDRLLTRIAKRNMEDIVPLAYRLEKAKGDILTSETLYEGMSHAYTGGNIGPISNNISKVWNSGEIRQEQLNVVKWLCFQNNAVIDYAKTLWLPIPPKHIQETIKSYTKARVPNFFIYAKDKTPSQVESQNNSAMNRIAAAIPDSRLRWSKTIGKFDYRMLMNQCVEFSVFENNPIVERYQYWSKHQYLFNTKDELHLNQEDLYMYQKMRAKILEDDEYSSDYIVNTLIFYLYSIKPDSSKKILWSCFGDIMLKNLQDNLNGAGQICCVCGKRFEPKNSLQICCSRECYTEHNKQLARGKKFVG